jgi:hypothetical protein
MLAFGRGKGRYKGDYLTKDLYIFYKDTTKDAVDYTTWLSIVREFNKISLMSCIYDSREITLPGRLGSVRIRKRKKHMKFNEDGSVNKKNLAVDWKKTKIKWKEKYPNLSIKEISDLPTEEKGLIYILNEHTNGYTFKFIWDKVISNIPNQNVYRMKLLRDINREVKEALVHNKELQYTYFE